MLRIWMFTGMLLLFGCEQSLTVKDLEHLNGYWEIEKVVFPDGKHKTYNANTTVDYIYLDDLKGFRKKVYPALDGSFDATDDVVEFKVIQKDGMFYMHYHKEQNDWTEELLAVSPDKFTVLNEGNIRYHYKKFQPIEIR